MQTPQHSLESRKHPDPANPKPKCHQSTALQTWGQEEGIPCLDPPLDPKKLVKFNHTLMSENGILRIKLRSNDQ